MSGTCPRRALGRREFLPRPPPTLGIRPNSHSDAGKFCPNAPPSVGNNSHAENLFPPSYAPPLRIGPNAGFTSHLGNLYRRFIPMWEKAPPPPHQCRQARASLLTASSLLVRRGAPKIGGPAPSCLRRAGLEKDPAKARAE